METCRPIHNTPAVKAREEGNLIRIVEQIPPLPAPQTWTRTGRHVEKALLHDIVRLDVQLGLDVARLVGGVGLPSVGGEFVANEARSSGDKQAPPLCDNTSNPTTCTNTHRHSKTLTIHTHRHTNKQTLTHTHTHTHTQHTHHHETTSKGGAPCRERRRCRRAS